MKAFWTILLLLFPLLTSAQQRISFDANTRLNTINFTARYMKVIKKPFFLTGGICFGLYGNGTNSYDSLDVVNSRNYSPYSKLDLTRVDTSGVYELVKYSGNTRGIGIDLGIGAYHEFSVVHGIRFNLNHRFMFVTHIVSAYYKDWTAGNILIWRIEQAHVAGAIIPELYHTIRIGGRSTFYYGIKSPYYYSMDKANYNPKTTNDILFGFEPELAFGLTYQVGNCD